MVNNMEIDTKNNQVVISVNPKIYPLYIVYSAAYVFLDRAYVHIDGDPNDEIIVRLQPREKMDLESLARDFNNELINYAVYAIHSEMNKDIREAIIARAFRSHSRSDDNE